MVTGLPRISSAVYPKRRSALLFQLVIMPSRFLLMMASSEESTIAPRSCAACCSWDSADFRGVMSISVLMPPVILPSSSRMTLGCGTNQNREPSGRSAIYSRPAGGFPTL